MSLDRWKVSTVVLSGALVLVVGGRMVSVANAQLKTVPRPVAITSDSTKKADGSKGTPSQRAVKLFESAKQTLIKAKDPTGHRDKALRLIEAASAEAKLLETGPEAEGN